MSIDEMQAKITSMDFLLAILVRLRACSESSAFKCFQRHRSKIIRAYQKDMV